MPFERSSLTAMDPRRGRMGLSNHVERKQYMKSNFARWSSAVPAALFAFGVGGAMAQPGGGHGPGHGGLEVEHVIASLKAQLNLNTSQQVMFDNAVASAKAARATFRQNMDQVH